MRWLASRLRVPDVRTVALVAPLIAAGCDRAPPALRESAPIRVLTAGLRPAWPRHPEAARPAPAVTDSARVDWRTDEEQEAFAAREREADPYRIGDSVASDGT